MASDPILHPILLTPARRRQRRGQASIATTPLRAWVRFCAGGARWNARPYRYRAVPLCWQSVQIATRRGCSLVRRQAIAASAPWLCQAHGW